MKTKLFTIALAALTVWLLASCTKENGSETPQSKLPEGALKGEFSVSAFKKVHFSQGNLQATYDGRKYTWGFAANQYDYVGKAAGNTTIDRQTKGAVVDLYGWSTEATTYGISTSTSFYDYSGAFKDWGTAIDNNGTWRTLTVAEWQYLFNYGSGANTTRVGLYAYGVTVVGKANCLVLYPDGFTGPKVTNYDITSYNEESEWTAAQNAGVVCLPAAGGRLGSDVLIVGDFGLYWSSTALDGSLAYGVTFFGSGDVYPDSNDDRNFGYSVRLVTESK